MSWLSVESVDSITAGLDASYGFLKQAVCGTAEIG